MNFARFTVKQVFSFQKTVAALALLILLPACTTVTTVVPLEVTTEFLPPSPIQVPFTVGVYHPPELASHVYSEEPTVDRRFIFRVGEATDCLLRGLYPSLFTNSVTVKKRPPLPPDAPPVDAVIEPNIEEFNIKAEPFRGGRTFCWAEIVYRFTIYSPGGPMLTSWKVRGIGERSGLELNEDLFTDAIKLAIRDAAERFQTSFFDTPEARRWSKKLPLKGVNAPIEAQTTLKVQQTVWALYPGVIAANAEFNHDPQLPSVLSVKVRVKNKGSHRLLVRPSDFSLELLTGRAAHVAPASALASSATVEHLRVSPLGPGPGFTAGGPPGFAIGNLISVIINLSAQAAEDRQFEEAFAKYRTESLGDTTVWQGDSVEIVVHFFVVPDTKMAENLTIPVIDLETSTRYLIRIPTQ
jgi:hypothetical protein